MPTYKHGAGSVYKRGTIWWIAFYANGNHVCESAKTTDKREARRLLQARVGEIADVWLEEKAVQEKVELEKRAIQAQMWLEKRAIQAQMGGGKQALQAKLDALTALPLSGHGSCIYFL